MRTNKGLDEWNSESLSSHSILSHSVATFVTESIFRTVKESRNHIFFLEKAPFFTQLQLQLWDHFLDPSKHF